MIVNFTNVHSGYMIPGRHMLGYDISPFQDVYRITNIAFEYSFGSTFDLWKQRSHQMRSLGKILNQVNKNMPREGGTLKSRVRGKQTDSQRCQCVFCEGVVSARSCGLADEQV